MNNKKITIPIIAVLVITIISMGVAFAAFSAVLTINGTAQIEASSWDIYFTNAAVNGVKPSSATPVPQENIYTFQTAEDEGSTYVATTYTWDASFKSPGDLIRYTIYVKNGGDYNASIIDIDTPEIHCSSDPQNGCSHLHYGLFTDTEGTDPLDNTFSVNAGQTGTFYLIAYLDDRYGEDSSNQASVANLVSSDVSTDPISVSVTFEQVGAAVSNNSGNQGGGSGSGSGGSQVANAEYFIPTYSHSVYNEELGYDEIADEDEHWGTMSEFSYVMPEGYENVTPAVYAKRVNNNVSLCQLYNGTEYCMDSSTTTANMQAICSSLSSVYNENYSDTLNSGDSEGCTGRVEDQDVHFQRDLDGSGLSIFYYQDNIHYEYNVSYYEDSEPYVSPWITVLDSDSDNSDSE